MPACRRRDEGGDSGGLAAGGAVTGAPPAQRVVFAEPITGARDPEQRRAERDCALRSRQRPRSGSCRRSFREFVDRVHPRFQWYDHCVRLAAVLQRVADDELHRRHHHDAAPSLEVGDGLAALHGVLPLPPSRSVGRAGLVCGRARLQALSRLPRLRPARWRALRDDAESVAEWETRQGGGFWAAGVGGPATGKGMHLGMLDDPIKNAEEAASAVIGERNREWWASTWYTRQEPGAALVVITTRWPGPGDIVGWLFEQEQADDQPERWHVVSLEAEKTDETPVVPPTCTLEPDPREPGEALCPERYPLAKLKKIAARIGSFFYRLALPAACRPPRRERCSGGSGGRRSRRCPSSRHSCATGISPAPSRRRRGTTPTSPPARSPAGCRTTARRFST
jgi:hypothetical protein